jgi:YVTN family beta-propeller protein
MKHISGWLLLRVACLVSLLAMALPAIPARAQTFAYVTNTFANTVSVIGTASNTVVATIAVGGGPFGVAITPDGTRAYVANLFDNTVSGSTRRRRQWLPR